MRIGTSAALAALWAFVLLWGTGGVLGQDNAGSGLIAPLGLGTNPDANVEVSVTDGDLLSVEEPIEGVVGKVGVLCLGCGKGWAGPCAPLRNGFNLRYRIELSMRV